MAARWHILDNVDGDRADRSLSATSKWWFFGTRDELYAWLPAYKDNANFALMDSEDPLSGTLWAPESSGGATDFEISNVRFNALDRFEWTVYVTAIDFSKGGAGGGSFRFPDRTKLDTEETVEMVLSVFPLTSDLIGWQRRDDGSQVDLKVVGTWVEATDCPFTTRPDIGYLDRQMVTSTIRKISYLPGDPGVNKATMQAFKGNQTIDSVTGRVVERSMRLILNSEGDKYTEWVRAVQEPPDGFAWNSSWKNY